MKPPTALLASPAPRRRCAEHGLAEPCRGCAADRLCTPKHARIGRPYLDAKMLAAGEGSR